MQRTHLSDAIFHGADLTIANHLRRITLAGAIFGMTVEDYWQAAGEPDQHEHVEHHRSLVRDDRRHGREPLRAIGVSFNFFATFDDVEPDQRRSDSWGLGDQASVSGNFTGANLSGIEIWKSGLHGNFTGANLTNVSVTWGDGEISGDFTNADLTGSNITGEFAMTRSGRTRPARTGCSERSLLISQRPGVVRRHGRWCR